MNCGERHHCATVRPNRFFTGPDAIPRGPRFLESDGLSREGKGRDSTRTVTVPRPIPPAHPFRMIPDPIGLAWLRPHSGAEEVQQPLAPEEPSWDSMIGEGIPASQGQEKDFGTRVKSPELFGFEKPGVSSLGHSPRLGELRAPVQVCGRRGRSLHSSQKIVECTGGPERVAVLRTILLRPTPLGIFQWHFAAFVAGGLKPSTPEQRSEVGQHS